LHGDLAAAVGATGVCGVSGCVTASLLSHGHSRSRRVKQTEWSKSRRMRGWDSHALVWTRSQPAQRSVVPWLMRSELGRGSYKGSPYSKRHGSARARRASRRLWRGSFLQPCCTSLAGWEVARVDQPKRVRWTHLLLLSGKVPSPATTPHVERARAPPLLRAWRARNNTRRSTCKLQLVWTCDNRILMHVEASQHLGRRHCRAVQRLCSHSLRATEPWRTKQPN
jgi:hypothetical protein